MMASLLAAGVSVSAVAPAFYVQAAEGKQVASVSDYQNHAYKDDIDYVLEKRVMWKYADGTFRPNAQITQGQLLTSLVAVMQLKEKAPVAQLPVGHWAKDIYEKSNKAGILAGVPIDPNRLLTKEEASLIVNNAWKPYHGGIWPGTTNYQHLIARRILPKVWGQTPESPFTRAEAAKVFKFLHIEYNGIVVGRKVADQFHNSLKVTNGVLVGNGPSPKGLTIKGTILKKDGSTIYLKNGMAIKVKATDVQRMVIMVFIPGKPEDVATYSYNELPKLTRVNEMIKKYD
ncbi:S-layer homology domain-containing protein [Brevibacillus sp. GCM10020057]|uniref:S-layer homology domain-containing protein n=1 Tax=Brevibacillus sp. GCM10020057 TaxID=3317327 RepID=UPI00363234F9